MKAPPMIIHRLDVDRLINDCGGVNMVKLRTGIPRTAIYSILRRGKMSTDQLAALLYHFNADVRDYMVQK